MAEARLKRENTLIKTENKKLNEKIDVLQSQCSSDCKTILSQIKQLDEYSEVVAKLKAKNAKLKKDHKKVSSLFDSTLKIKLQYEKVIERLYEAADTQGLTRAVIQAVKPKRKKPVDLDGYDVDVSPISRYTLVGKYKKSAAMSSAFMQKPIFDSRSKLEKLKQKPSQHSVSPDKL